MCGLALCFGANHEEKVMFMIQQMQHRGIRSNMISKDNISLGHVRLPIQGLSTKFDQPYKNNLCFVGEIFNYKLFDKNFQSDVELVHQVLENNLSQDYRIFSMFDGLWAIAYIKENSTFIYTDHLAKKPLYALLDQENGSIIAICSEILPLVLISEKLEWNNYNLSQTAKWGYSTQNNTPYLNITKILPNRKLVINNKTGEIVSTTSFIPFPAKPRYNLRASLEIAVKNRLVSDVPVSLLMSGGLDSTIIYYLVKKYTSNITVFHIDNNEEEYLNYIDFSGVTVKKISLEEEDITNKTLTPALISNQTPIDLGSMLPQYLLGQAIEEEDFHVAISGDGADELFGGYRRIEQYDSQYSDVFDELVHYHLPRLDRQMMAHTVEIRCPFLSPNVMNNALQIPYEFRIHKKILKDTFRNLIPKEIIERKKEPLKIKQIHQNKENWQLFLIDLFKKMMREIYEYQRYIG